MTTATATQRNAPGLPPALGAAQAAMQSTEVQEMLRRLSAHGLGICMPHMHDEETGEFQLLPDQLMQVEAGLEVRFQPTAEVTKQAGRFLPVAWVWRDGTAIPSTVCEMVQDKDAPDDEAAAVKHKHPTRN
ncbi:hypothetical protein [Thermomonas sp.]|uniref:hypothetical protein n=1 Tax=Thermomonas sp. TaxID=1971895 RepID=UPI0024894AE5|nr:hypothetical protein [Thermomonas sp.]MDI1252497.1 hypothetical protein [Thermomonas sp.]